MGVYVDLYGGNSFILNLGTRPRVDLGPRGHALLIKPSSKSGIFRHKPYKIRHSTFGRSSQVRLSPPLPGHHHHHYSFTITVNIHPLPLSHIDIFFLLLKVGQLCHS